MMWNKTATLRRIFMAPADDAGSDLGGAGALDIETRISNALSLGNEGDDDSVDVDVDDDQNDDLPDNSDTDADDDVTDSEEDDATLASILGLSDESLAYDDAGNVVFNATINGEPKQVTIQDLVKSYQLEGHINQKSMKLESERRDFESTRDKAYDELTQRLNSANSLIELAQNQLLQDFQSIDWDTLRATDPAEWTAMRQHYMERNQLIQQAKNSIATGSKGLTEEQQREQALKKQEFMNGEITKMISDNPAWKDQAVMAKEVGELGKFLNEAYGFSPEEVANAMDSRLMRMIKDAHAYRSGKQALKEKQIPSNVPKFRKPGSNNVSRNDMQKARDAKARKDNIRKSGGNTDSIAAALLDRM